MEMWRRGRKKRKQQKTPKGKVKPKNERIKKNNMEKLHFGCFLYKWSSVIKEVEPGPVCPSSRRVSWWITGVLRKDTFINDGSDAADEKLAA